MDQATNLRNIIKQHEINNFVEKKRNAKIITVTSGKGGVGKSNISINLAICLSRLNQRVIILDADFGLANVEVMLGIRPKYNFADLLFHGKGIQEVITPGPENVGFISGGSGIEELLHLDANQIRNLSEKIWELDEIADYIIIDTGAGISETLLHFIRSSDQTLLVATPEPTSITDAYAVLKSVSRHTSSEEEPFTLHMVANRVESYEEGKQLHAKFNVVVTKFLHVKLDYIGAVLQDPLLTKAVMEQKPVSISYPNAPASKSLMQLAEMIHNKTVNVQKDRGGIRQLLSNFLRKK